MGLYFDYFLAFFVLDILQLNFRMQWGWRKKYCICVVQSKPLGSRLCDLRVSVSEMFDTPDKYTVSMAAHRVGCLLGWFVGVSFIRMSLDNAVWDDYNYNYTRAGCVHDALHPQHCFGAKAASLG
jgi:hypothetical protein